MTDATETHRDLEKFEKFVRENPLTARDIGADAALAQPSPAEWSG